MNLETDLTSFRKINSKWNIDLKCKTQNYIKLLEDTIGEKPDVLGYSDDFLDITLKVRSMNEITDNFNFIKIKNFCSMRVNIKRIRRQAIDWENILAKDTSERKKKTGIHNIQRALKNQQ